MPYASLVRVGPHNDAVVSRCQECLRDEFRRGDVLAHVIKNAGIPERTLKRRFKAATGMSLLEYAQGLRIEEAKRLLETGELSVEAISAAVGYEDYGFFRRLFKRLTGLTPGKYRRLFQPLLASSGG